MAERLTSVSGGHRGRYPPMIDPPDVGTSYAAASAASSTFSLVRFHTGRKVLSCCSSGRSGGGFAEGPTEFGRRRVRAAQQVRHSFADRLSRHALVKDEAWRWVDLEAVIFVAGRPPQVDPGKSETERVRHSNAG